MMFGTVIAPQLSYTVPHDQDTDNSVLSATLRPATNLTWATNDLRLRSPALSTVKTGNVCPNTSPVAARLPYQTAARARTRTDSDGTRGSKELEWQAAR